MSSNISLIPKVSDAYKDNLELQDALSAKTPASTLSLPLPEWFTTLRAATAFLNDAAIDAAVSDAFVVQINLQDSFNAEKANIDREVSVIKFQEKIWRTQARERSAAILAAERRTRASEEFNAKSVKPMTSTLEDFVAKFKKLENGEPNEELKAKMGKNLEKLAASIGKINEGWAKHEIETLKEKGKKRAALEEEGGEKMDGGPNKRVK